MSTTPRLSLPVPATTDVADIPGDIEALADRLDTIAAWDDQGTLASRGAAAKRGRYYYATDTGQLFRDTGSAWVEIQVGSIAKADLATDALNAFLKLAVAGDHKVKWGLYDDGAGWGLTPERTWTIPHGLGGVPVFCFAQAMSGTDDLGTTTVFATSIDSYDGTNIVARSRDVRGHNVNFPGHGIFWLAIA